jgi:hypothetical protein
MNGKVIDARDRRTPAPWLALDRCRRRLVADIPSYAAGGNTALIKHPFGAVT